MKVIAIVPPERASFLYLDVFRSIAAVLVVLNHARDLTLVDYSTFNGASLPVQMLYFVAGLGHQSVMIFFVLSGFWISRAVVRREGQERFWSSYLIDRVSRLAIVLVPVLLIGGSLDWIGLHMVAPDFYNGVSGAHSMPRVSETLSWRSLAATLTFLQYLTVPPFGSNAPLWSLACEFWYYIWFPAAWFAIRKRPSFALLAFGLALVFPVLLVGFLSWLCGTALFFVSELVTKRGWVGKHTIAWPVLALGVASFVWAMVRSRIHPEAALSDLIVSASFAFALLGLFLVAPPQSRAVRLLATFGAHSSYSLYAIHFPLIAFAMALINPGPRLQPSMGSVGIILALIALAITVSFGFSYLTERRTTMLRRWLNRSASSLWG